MTSEDIEEIVLKGLDVPVQTPSNLLVPRMAFVDHLSRINVIANKAITYTKAKGILDVFRGNGKDEPVLFQHHCQKTPGCPYSTDNSYTLLVYEAVYSVEKVEKLNTVEKTYQCTVEGCFKSFSTENALKVHKNDIHDFKLRACKVEGCDPTILYDSGKAIRKHQTTVHPL